MPGHKRIIILHIHIRWCGSKNIGASENSAVYTAKGILKEEELVLRQIICKDITLHISEGITMGILHSNIIISQSLTCGNSPNMGKLGIDCDTFTCSNIGKSFLCVATTLQIHSHSNISLRPRSIIPGKPLGLGISHLLHLRLPGKEIAGQECTGRNMQVRNATTDSPEKNGSIIHHSGEITKKAILAPALPRGKFEHQAALNNIFNRDIYTVIRVRTVTVIHQKLLTLIQAETHNVRA